jgi:hypothetical protein
MSARRWIEANPPPKGFEFMHSYLVLSRWDSSLVERAISDLCLHTEGADWQEVAGKLSRYGSWEFADYSEATCARLRQCSPMTPERPDGADVTTLDGNTWRTRALK